LLVITISGYVVLCFTFLAVTTYTLREHSRELFDEQQRWLDLYLSTCISDLRTGNTLALRRKLKKLVNDKMFSRVELTAGGFKVVETRSPNEKNELNFLTRWFLVKMVPDHEIIIDVRDEYSTDWGTLRARLDGGILAEQIEEKLAIYIRVGAGLFLILLGAILLAIRKETQPIVEITDYISRFTRAGSRPHELENLLSQPLKFAREEWHLLGNAFKGAIQSLLKLEQQVRQKNIDAELSKVAIQVAHDIRNPLAVIATAASLPDGTSRTKIAPLLQGAARQISTIADDLLRKYRGVKAAAELSAPHSALFFPELLAPHVEFAIASIQVQNRDLNRIDWQFSVDEGGQWSFARVDESRLRRVLTILLQNSVDAIHAGGAFDERGSISVKISRAHERWVVITIADSGEGMNASVLNRVLAGTATSVKKDGNAIGVRYVLATIKEWGGKLEYESSPGLGTTARVIIPLSPLPLWLAGPVGLDRFEDVLVLDDGPLFHEIWRKRLLEIYPTAGGPEMHFYYDKTSLQVWRETFPERASRALYLVDYELGDGETGLSFIVQKNLTQKSILVTGREKDVGLIERAEAAGVKVLPKSLVPWVPLQQTPAAYEG
jgi:signal transduction histidine kinase